MAPKTDSIINQTIQAVILSALSNVLAQLIQITRSTSHHPFDFSRLFQFVLFTALNTPPNILWQGYIEEAFPAYTIQPHVRHYQRSSRAEDFSELKTPSPLENKTGAYERKTAREDVKQWEDSKQQWTEEVTMERRLDIRNTAWKFGLDQTVGALVNTMIFVSAMAGLRGEGWNGALKHMREVRIAYSLSLFWPSANGKGHSTSHACRLQTLANRIDSKFYRHSSRTTCGVWKFGWGGVGHFLKSFHRSLMKCWFIRQWLCGLIDVAL